MTEEKAMGISRARTLEWNLNTVIQLITLVGMCVGGVTIWVDKSRDIEELQTWRAGHEQYHKERLAEVKAQEARMEERFRGLESDSRKTTSQVENLSYRVTVTEQTSTSTATAIKELQSAVSQLTGDTKVVREILQRIEAAQRRGGDQR
jgi:chromosome segregation ATPase